ncbi:hypothetical protein [Pseudonocardia dioxanivorans]|uniref:hypothetical protein n=1 Tax=Pseudonocardia dioxanivorans TaxID=240495 RepID=UPI000CD1E68E|nr:hypothetical protein [Pseudonocardia dioxanivorans]
MIVVVDLGELRWRRDVGVGEWIGERLGGPFGYVGSVVPRGYAAYARVLHPVPAPGPSFDGAPLRWADVCRATGRRLHALAQWSAIAVPPGVPITYDARWRDVAPDVGNLGRAALDTLLGLLGAPGTPCFFALWEGFGWIHGSPAVVVVGSDEEVPPELPREVLDGPRLRLPHRDYIVFSGPLRDAVRIGHTYSWGEFATQSPTLFWAADRSWCVASEIDFDSTLVGGSAELVAAVPGLPGPRGPAGGTRRLAAPRRRRSEPLTVARTGSARLKGAGRPATRA